MPSQIKAFSPLDPASQRNKTIRSLGFCDRQQIDKQNVRACFVAQTMHTVNKNTFHCIQLFITKLQYKNNYITNQFIQKPLFSNAGA